MSTLTTKLNERIDCPTDGCTGPIGPKSYPAGTAFYCPGCGYTTSGVKA